MFNPFMHDVEKWPNLIETSCGVKDFSSIFGHFSTSFMTGKSFLQNKEYVELFIMSNALPFVHLEGTSYV